MSLISETKCMNQRTVLELESKILLTNQNKVALTALELPFKYMKQNCKNIKAISIISETYCKNQRTELELESKMLLTNQNKVALTALELPFEYMKQNCKKIKAISIISETYCMNQRTVLELESKILLTNQNKVALTAPQQPSLHMKQNC